MKWDGVFVAQAGAAAAARRRPSLANPPAGTVFCFPSLAYPPTDVRGLARQGGQMGQSPAWATRILVRFAKNVLTTVQKLPKHATGKPKVRVIVGCTAPNRHHRVRRKLRITNISFSWPRDRPGGVQRRKRRVHPQP
jgi:hypothetical protein